MISVLNFDTASVGSQVIRGQQTDTKMSNKNISQVNLRQGNITNDY
jgi:hypothetical protein